MKRLRYPTRNDLKSQTLCGRLCALPSLPALLIAQSSTQKTKPQECSWQAKGRARRRSQFAQSGNDSGRSTSGLSAGLATYVEADPGAPTATQVTWSLTRRPVRR
jgi:hypothetical protein